MSFEIIGQLIQKGEPESKGKDGTFMSRTFAIKIAGRYDEFPAFQLTQDRCSIIDRFNEGDFIKVSFDLRGRLWEGKYFTNLNCWRIDPADGEPHQAAPPAAAPATSAPSADIDWNAPLPQVPAQEGSAADADSDLPF